MSVIEFIAANWDFILLIVAAVAAVVYSAYKGNKSVIMKMLYALVTEAEKEYGGGTGSLKLATVIAQIYPNLPAFLKLFVTEETITKWVEDALVVAKEAWERNIAIAEYIEKPGEPETADTSEAVTASATFLQDSYN